MLSKKVLEKNSIFGWFDKNVYWNRSLNIWRKKLLYIYEIQPIYYSLTKWKCFDPKFKILPKKQPLL